MLLKVAKKKTEHFSQVKFNALKLPQYTNTTYIYYIKILHDSFVTTNNFLIFFEIKKCKNFGTAEYMFKKKKHFFKTFLFYVS